VAEAVSNYPAGRKRPPAGHFCLQGGASEQDLLGAAKRCHEGGELSVVADRCSETASRVRLYCKVTSTWITPLPLQLERLGS
jgi:hypothetical protein